MPNKYKSLFIAFLATTTRYYNYSIFGFSASTLSTYLMPEATNEYQMLLFFLIFSLSNFTRPIGAMIFGPIGDKIGRVHSIKIAATFSAFSTILVAFIPNFAFLGITSVIMLTISRMLFMLSFAGEIDAIKIFASEVNKNYRYIANSLVTFFSQIGVVIASLCYHFTSIQYNFEWLWRVNFIIGGLMGLMIILLKKHLVENEEFLAARPDDLEDSRTLFYIISTYKLKFSLALLINGLMGGVYHFLIIFFNSFLYYTARIITADQASFNNIILITLYIISTPLAGYISEKTRSILQPLIALLASVILLIIMIYAGTNYYTLIQRFLVILAPFYCVSCGVMMLSIFPTIDKMRMCSLSHSIGSLLLSSTTPVFCMIIWQYNHSIESILGYFLLSVFILVLALLYIQLKNLIPIPKP
jgi:MHS family proline/betaine transporter-like MFS transporter